MNYHFIVCVYNLLEKQKSLLIKRRPVFFYLKLNEFKINPLKNKLHLLDIIKS